VIGLVLVLAALGAMWGALALLLGPHRWVVAGSPRAARPRTTKTPTRAGGRPDAARPEEEHEDDEGEGEGGPVSREAEDWATADWLVGEVEKEAAERLGEDAPAPEDKQESKEPGAEEREEGR